MKERVSIFEPFPDKYGNTDLSYTQRRIRRLPGRRAPRFCIGGGFHTAVETNQVDNKIFMRVFAFATRLDTDVANDIFGDPAAFVDVNALSHELAEVANDPFVNKHRTQVNERYRGISAWT